MLEIGVLYSFHSLSCDTVQDTKPHVSSVVSLFLLSQVFLIITHVPLVHILASIILTGDMDIFSQGACDNVASHRVAQVTCS
jgi:hypothetical protein